MYVSRAATRAAPAVLRAGIRTAGRPQRSLPKTLPAIAILLPRRPLSTDTSTSSGSGGSFPPPGFSAEQAKKPLPKEDQKTAEKSAASDIPDVKIPRDGPTALPKTNAEEKQTLTELAAEKAGMSKDQDARAVSKKEEEKQKLTIWQKVKKEANHYWDGTKLLVAEVKISSKLALKMAAGYELTRREHRQVC
jgi:LETM1 and EF-hand domain-containing protein 1, mitochondrial